MVKKLLLFAILSPLAMQPVMKANALTEAAKNIAMPWSEAARTKNAKGVSFNSWVDLVTLGLTFGSALYTTGFNSPLQNTRAARLHSVITDENSTFALPYFLAVYDLYKSIGLVINRTPDNKAKLTLTLMKIIANLGLKGAPKLFRTK